MIATTASTRNTRWWAPFAALLVLLVAACSTNDTPKDVAAAGVTVTHAKGKVEIPRAPTRVVALGAGDVQMASALGAEIVGAVANPFATNKNWPGTPGTLPESVLRLDAVTPDLDAIAATRPDVILATTAQQTYIDKYEQLTRIAPTVVYKTAPFADSGAGLLDLIGDALGKHQQASELISQSQKVITDFAASHPQLKGQTFAFGQYAGGHLYLLAADKNPSTRFLAALGMTLAPEVARLGESTAANGFATLSPEQYSRLSSAQRILISTPGDLNGEQFTRTPAVAVLNGRLHIISTDVAGALLTANPASTEYLLEQLGPAVL